MAKKNSEQMTLEGRIKGLNYQVSGYTTNQNIKFTVLNDEDQRLYQVLSVMKDVEYAMQIYNILNETLNYQRRIVKVQIKGDSEPYLATSKIQLLKPKE